MKAEMLQSQFLSLEEPDDVVVIDIAFSPEEIVEQIVAMK